jgi:mycothiol synthase
MSDLVNDALGGRRIDILDELEPDVAQDVLRLIAEAARTDGQQAVSEQGRLQLRGQREGVRHLVLRDRSGELVGYAQLEDTDPVEAPAAELVVHPVARGRGHGRALGLALLKESEKRLRVWAHGGHASARHLAQTLGLTRFRELRQMRRPLGPPAELDIPEPTLPPGVAVRTFRPGEDDAAWLAVNAAAFAHHPEQGSLTQRDLDDRKAEPWFDPEGFFLAVRAGAGAGDGGNGSGSGVGEALGPALGPAPGNGDFLGFHWTKVHAEERLGEVYVVGVRPDAQGGGLGRALTAIGLRYLAAQGLPTAMLYVDADNTAAVTVYERLGFTTYETDLMYRIET